jgi:predicted nucleic acid-binding protein
MLYLDSSSLLKLIWLEPESAAVRRQVALETHVLVSSLAELEAEVQLRAHRLAGAVSPARFRRQREILAILRDLEPFEFRELTGDVFRRAIQQAGADAGHCRTLDRLHLAAMEELGASRLMTHDRKQAAAADALGYAVLSPDQ